MAYNIGKQFGNYQLLSELGQGGMAKVYLAQDTHLKRNIAIKIILSGKQT